ncbi:hypothetical protein [Nonomuraea sp. NPDC049695]|uniref:hypothetical protein n=1 Tax=Nonomuraea sp. NPDC049695 TaxID=3154734 RepID=UPI00343D8E07
MAGQSGTLPRRPYAGLAAVRGRPARILQITGVWPILAIHPDAEHAATAMRDHVADGTQKPS